MAVANYEISRPSMLRAELSLPPVPFGDAIGKVSDCRRQDSSPSCAVQAWLRGVRPLFKTGTSTEPVSSWSWVVAGVRLVTRSMKWVALGLGASICLGCGTASVVLKPALVDRCKQTGLRGCDMIVKGMIRYAEGDKAGAAGFLAKGGSQNSPEEVEVFATTVQQLRDVPGAAEYLGPLDEALSLLEVEAAAAVPTPVAPPGLASKAGPPPVPPLASPGYRADDPSMPMRMLTAATDPRQAVDGVYTPGERHIPFACDKIVQEPATCSLVAKGPFYLTDLMPLGADCTGQFIAVVNDGAARWLADGPPRFAGANLFVRDNELLLFGRRGAPNSDPAVPINTGCSFLWSAYRPYEVADAAVESGE